MGGVPDTNTSNSAKKEIILCFEELDVPPEPCKSSSEVNKQNVLNFLSLKAQKRDMFFDHHWNLSRTDKDIDYFLFLAKINRER